MSEVLVEEVRLELEMHYDDVASETRLQKQTGSGCAEAGPRKTTKVKPSDKNAYYTKAVRERLRGKFESVKLPQRVKDLLRKPKDEDDWGKLQTLRDIVRDECEGARISKIFGTFRNRKSVKFR